VEETLAETEQSFVARTVAMFGLGLVGVGGLALTVVLVPAALPPVPEVPRSVLLLLSVIQPTILVLLAAGLGAYLAPAVGLRSHLAARYGGTPVEPSIRASLGVAVPVGLAVGVALVGIDILGFVRAGGPLDPGTVSLATVLGSAPLRFLYGGITEEILLRWGLMTLLVWVAWRIRGRPARPSTASVWAAILVSAVLFGAGHLPAAAAGGGLSAVGVGRIVLLNAIAGVAYGWLYWRWSLEAAMVGHASTHVVILGTNLLVAL
jgi:hypothetical protein